MFGTSKTVRMPAARATLSVSAPRYTSSTQSRALTSSGGGGDPFTGGGGGAPAPAPSYSAPSSVNIDTPVNPMEKYSYDRWASYDKGLAEGTNEEITRELQRARDELSVGLEREGEAAIGRGADPALFRARAMSEGRRGIHALQGKLADVALGRRAEALSGLTSAAGRAAEGQRTLHLGTQAARLAEQRYKLDEAEAADRRSGANYDRLLRMSGMTNLLSSPGYFSGGTAGIYGI